MERGQNYVTFSLGGCSPLFELGERVQFKFGT